MKIAIYLMMATFTAFFSGSTRFASAANAPVPQTGQTIRYADYDDGWYATKVGVKVGVAWPNPRFTDNGDGTVTDNLTGLIWLKDANAMSTLSWAAAGTACAAMCDGMYGLTDGSAAGDWRLPNARELHSLCHFGQRNPALSNTAGTGQWSADNPFVNVQSLWYWSSTVYHGATANAYFWHAQYGAVDTAPKSSSYTIWPVRGVTTGPAPVPKTGTHGIAWPNPRFTDNGDGTVTDNLTDLIWLKDANAMGTLAWESALTSCALVSDGIYGLTDGSAAGDWRLPNARELHSLCHFGQHGPALSNTAGTGQWSEGNPFTNVQSLRYWSSTTYSGSTANAYCWHALYGGVVTQAKTTAFYVWPVRGPPPRSGTVISFH